MPAWKINDVIAPLTAGGGYKPEILLRTPVSAEPYRDETQKVQWALRSVEPLRASFPPEQYGTDTVGEACQRIGRVLERANAMPAGRPGDAQVFVNLTSPTSFTGSTRPGSKINQMDYYCEFEVQVQSYAPVSAGRDADKVADWIRRQLSGIPVRSRRDSAGFEHVTHVSVEGDGYIERPPGPAGAVKSFVSGGVRYSTDRPENYDNLGPNDWD